MASDSSDLMPLDDKDWTSAGDGNNFHCDNIYLCWTEFHQSMGR